MKIRKNVLMLSLIAVLLAAMTALPSSALPSTELRVQPTHVISTASFSTDVTVNYVLAMWGYEIKLFYDTDVLTATDIHPKSPFLLGWGEATGIDDAEGLVWIAYSMELGEGDGFDYSNPVDPYEIVTIDFSIDGPGASPLALEVSKISDPVGSSIPHIAYSGDFRDDFHLPLAWFSMAPGTLVGETVVFTSLGTDLDGSIVAWDWVFGDGDTETGSETTHAYTAADTYTATLTVTDNDGYTDSHSRKITILPIPPPGADLLTAEAEYRKLNVAARKTCKLFAEAINLDEDNPVLVRMMIFVYDEGVNNLGTMEAEDTVGPGETKMFEFLFDGTSPQWEIAHAKLEWLFRAECWYNDFDLPNGDHHWAQIDEPTEIWFSMIGKDPHL